MIIFQCDTKTSTFQFQVTYSLRNAENVSAAFKGGRADIPTDVTGRTVHLFVVFSRGTKCSGRRSWPPFLFSKPTQNVHLWRPYFSWELERQNFPSPTVWGATQVYIVQCPAKEWFPGCENFVLAVAYHFCLALPEKFSQPGDHSFAGPCTIRGGRIRWWWWQARHWKGEICKGEAQVWHIIRKVARIPHAHGQEWGSRNHLDRNFSQEVKYFMFVNNLWPQEVLWKIYYSYLSNHR